MSLNEWINPKYLKKEEILKIQIEFLSKKPFEYLSLYDFLLDEKAIELSDALKKENYYLEDHDLYCFLRTIDFKDIKNKVLIEFRKFLIKKNTIKFFEDLTNSKINKKVIDLHSLKLENTHYLLCHDDLVKARQFAFIFNLSENWTSNDKGELEIFESDSNLNVTSKISKSIIPKFNQFNLFKVQKKSYHQVNEVESEKSRISIGGWYHE